MRQSCSFLQRKMWLSPTTLAPFSKVASSCTSAVVTGSTRPVMASTWLILSTARSKLGMMPVRAARNRLPKLCPARLPSVKR